MTGLLHVPFFEEELLTSYLSRMARANGREEMRLFLADLGFSASAIVRGDLKQACRLEELLGREPGTLSTHGFSPVDTRHVRTRGMVFSSGTIAPYASRFCSHCLDEDLEDVRRMPGTRMYARIQWALRCVFACDRHETELVAFGGSTSRSAGRQAAFLPIDDTLETVRDFSTLAESWRSTGNSERDRAGSFPSTAFERFVAQRLRGTAGHGDLLDGMPLPACIDACRLLGSASRFGREFRLYTSRSEDDRSLLTEGYDLLRESENAVRPLLDRLARGRLADVPSFHGSLSKLLESRPATHAPLKLLVRDHAERHVKAVLRDVKARAQETTSVGMVAASVDLPPRTVARYLLERGVIRTLGSKPADIEITTESARSAIAILGDIASFEDIRKSLGCTVAQIRSIARCGLLDPVFGHIPEGSTAGTDYYSRSALAALRLSVASRADSEASGAVPLRAAMQMTGVPAGELLRLVVQGHLEHVAYDSALPLFEGLMVDSEEIDRYGREAGEQQASARSDSADIESEIFAYTLQPSRLIRGQAKAVRRRSEVALPPPRHSRSSSGRRKAAGRSSRQG